MLNIRSLYLLSYKKTLTQIVFSFGFFLIFIIFLVVHIGGHFCLAIPLRIWRSVRSPFVLLSKFGKYTYFTKNCKNAKFQESLQQNGSLNLSYLN